MSCREEVCTAAVVEAYTCTPLSLNKSHPAEQLEEMYPEVQVCVHDSSFSNFLQTNPHVLIDMSLPSVELEQDNTLVCPGTRTSMEGEHEHRINIADAHAMPFHENCVLYSTEKQCPVAEQLGIHDDLFTKCRQVYYMSDI